MISDSRLAPDFLADGRCGACPVIDMHGHMGGWAGIFFLNGAWHAVGGAKEERPRLLSIGERLVALAAADDWLNTYETDESAHKSRRWLREPPTERQLVHLPPTARADLAMTRYQASALLTFKFNRQAIQHLVRSAQPAALGQAA